MNALVVGVGNPYRHDDAVGPEVVRRLREAGLVGVTLAECDGEPSALLELWAGADLAVVVDAVRSGAHPPGTIHRLRHSSLRHSSLRHSSLRHSSAGTAASGSSHAVDLGETVALAAALDRLPGELRLYAVEAADVSLGVGISPAVEAALPALVREITEIVQTSAGRSALS